MASSPPPNVKIYDRPERKGPSPLLLVIALVVLIAIAFVVYRAVHHSAPARVQTGRALRPAGNARQRADVTHFTHFTDYTRKGTHSHENHRRFV